MSLHPCFRRRWLLQVCLGKAFHAFVDISVFLWLRTKILPRLAQGLFSNERTWQNHWSYCPNEWKMEKAECQHAPICAIPCQHGPTLQFVSCAEKDSLSGTVMMAWIWHVWINAMVLVPMAQAPPKAGAKELSYNSLNLIPHACFRRRWLLQVCLGKPSHGNRKKYTLDISVFLSWIS